MAKSQVDGTTILLKLEGYILVHVISDTSLIAITI